MAFCCFYKFATLNTTRFTNFIITTLSKWGLFVIQKLDPLFCCTNWVALLIKKSDSKIQFIPFFKQNLIRICQIFTSNKILNLFNLQRKSMTRVCIIFKMISHDHLQNVQYLRHENSLSIMYLFNKVTLISPYII